MLSKVSTRFPLFLSKTWSRTCCFNLDVRSWQGFKQVCRWLSTCFWHAFDLLATCFRHAHASRKPGLQLARIMECGLNSFIHCVIYLLLQISIMGQLQQTHSKAFSFRGLRPLTSHRGLCPWTPAGAPDPRYRLALRARHGIRTFCSSKLILKKKPWPIPTNLCTTSTWHVQCWNLHVYSPGAIFFSW